MNEAVSAEAGPTGLDNTPFTLERIAGHIGARITDINLCAPLDEQQRAGLRQALAAHHVLELPGQPMDPAQHFAFGEIFGPLMDLPHIPREPGHELLHRVYREAGETTRLAGGRWHADSTFLESPPAVVVMKAVDVPRFGGDTMFSSAVAAYESLSPRMRDLIDDLDGVHSATRVFGQAARDSGASYRLREGMNTDAADARMLHPLAPIDVLSGARHLFVNRTYTTGIDGLDDDEAAALIGLLCDRIADLPMSCRIRWRPETVVVWNNRTTHHRGIADFQGSFRHLVRTTHSGVRPAR